jgi:hypothetical protein
MRNLSVVTAISMLAVVASPLALPAQMQPAPPPKPLSIQVTGGAMFPVFGYADYTAGTGWKAQAALVLRRNAYYNIRLEGEYNTVGGEGSSSNATFNVLGFGLGGGRVVAKGKVQQEGYFVVGGYEWDGEICTGGGSCTNYSEWQFGTKVGTNAVFGSGKAKFVLDFHWLYTWSEPYTNLLAITGGLRF